MTAARVSPHEGKPRLRILIGADTFWPEINGAATFIARLGAGLAAAALLGTYFVQTAHSSNPPDLVVAGLTVIDPIVAVSIGIIVLGEAASAPLWAIFAFAAAAAAAIWGVVSLSRNHPGSLANTTLADVVDGRSEGA